MSAKIGSRDGWRTARLALLEREKDLNRRRDELAAARRELPWVPVERDYRFEGPDGSLSLRDLFGGCSQLLVYHFMFGEDWAEGCPSCSFWADTFDRIPVHLTHRDIAFVAVSSAPYEKLAGYRDRMGWSFPWVSSGGSDFNVDFGVTLHPGQTDPEYNFVPTEVGDEVDERPGASAFVRDGGRVFHTYSTYARGLDPLNSAYQWLDLAPRGRDEDDLPWPMAWLHRRDAYD